MRPLSTAELLHVWEQGLAQPLVRRALSLLCAACPQTPPDELARLSIGRRDARLLTLREWTFGPRFVSVTNCPECGEQLELEFDTADIRVEPPIENNEPRQLDAEDCHVCYRLPNSADLAVLGGQETLADARRVLVERCVLAIERLDTASPGEGLSDELIDLIGAGMAEHDPQADVQLDLECPACGRQWQATFDIVSFFWSEITSWAYRILSEIHILASAYGWREADILALSPWRRRRYLDMVGA